MDVILQTVIRLGEKALAHLGNPVILHGLGQMMQHIEDIPQQRVGSHYHLNFIIPDCKLQSTAAVLVGLIKVALDNFSPGNDDQQQLLKISVIQFLHNLNARPGIMKAVIDPPSGIIGQRQHNISPQVIKGIQLVDEFMVNLLGGFHGFFRFAYGIQIVADCPPAIKRNRNHLLGILFLVLDDLQNPLGGLLVALKIKHPPLDHRPVEQRLEQPGRIACGFQVSDRSFDQHQPGVQIFVHKKCVCQHQVGNPHQLDVIFSFRNVM